jgi:hypothetical protein
MLLKVINIGKLPHLGPSAQTDLYHDMYNPTCHQSQNQEQADFRTVEQQFELHLSMS